MNIDEMSIRQLQLESARVIASIEATKHNIVMFNKSGFHDSQQWYKNTILWYISKFGDLPSKIGPGKEIKLLYEKT